MNSAIVSEYASAIKYFPLNPFEAKPPRTARLERREIYSRSTFSRSLHESYSRPDGSYTIKSGAYRYIAPASSFIDRLDSLSSFPSSQKPYGHEPACLSILSFTGKSTASIRHLEDPFIFAIESTLSWKTVSIQIVFFNSLIF